MNILLDNNAEWHKRQNERIARIAKEMGRLFAPGHESQQSVSYEAKEQELLWLQHEKAEHDKFIPPDYSDHRFG